MNKNSAIARQLLMLAGMTHHRQLLVLSGEEAWGRALAEEIIAETRLVRVVWISSTQNPEAEVLPASKVKKLLGQERDAVVFDAYAGFDPDAFGAVSGIIPGGGILLLVCPPLDEWETFADPAAERIASWPLSAADISGRFIRRFVRVLRNARGVTLLQQHASLPDIDNSFEPAADTGFTHAECRTADQQQAVAAIEQLYYGQSHQPLVLSSDRGRGKSASLGIAAARLMQAMPSKSGLRIVLTAPRPDAVSSVFAQASHLLPNAERSANALRYQDSCLEFHAPDELLLSEIPADLLFVDEAAAIPTALLQQLLSRYTRIVFATTVHGYEGTGRGFALRFRTVLDRQCPGWRGLTLNTPIRWAQDDPLEAFVFRALLLDADSADDEGVKEASLETTSIECLERDALAEDESLLAQLFGLLVAAHYRTTPNDLRNMLDGPGLSIYVMRFKQMVVATALVSSEGPFDDELAAAIYHGKRRPQGHMIPQSLLTHAGIREAGDLRCARIMRIAVHPVLQYQGLGTGLLSWLRDELEVRGYDLLGSSFGATRELLRFWRKSNLLPVRIGFRRDHASSEHSIMVLQALSDRGEEVYQLARERMRRDLPFWLADPLQDLDETLADDLKQEVFAEQENALANDRLTRHDREMLQAFAQGQRSYEDSLGPLWRLYASWQDQGGLPLSRQSSAVLNLKLMQKNPWSVVAREYGLGGRAGVLQALREAVGKLLQVETGSPA